MMFSRAREDLLPEHQSLSLKGAARSARARRKQEMTSSASKESEPAGPPLPQQGAFRRLDDGSRRIGAIALPSKTEPGVFVPGPAAGPGTSRPDGRPVPFLRSPCSLQSSSRFVMGRAAHLRTRGVKNGRKTNARASRRAPRAGLGRKAWLGPSVRGPSWSTPGCRGRVDRFRDCRAACLAPGLALLSFAHKGLAGGCGDRVGN